MVGICCARAAVGGGDLPEYDGLGTGGEQGKAPGSQHK